MRMQERFKQIREFYNLSQAQFAQKIHRVPAFIANVETGRCGVSGKTLDAICEAFPINRGWLMSGEGEMFTQGSEQRPVDKGGIPQRVKEVRKWAGLTQEEFAQQIGYSKIQVHSVEKEKVTPSNQFLEKVVTEFGLNAEWMFTGMGSMEVQERGIDDHVDDKLIKWLNEHPEVIRELRKRGGLD